MSNSGGIDLEWTAQPLSCRVILLKRISFRIGLAWFGHVLVSLFFGVLFCSPACIWSQTCFRCYTHSASSNLVNACQRSTVNARHYCKNNQNALLKLLKDSWATSQGMLWLHALESMNHRHHSHPQPLIFSWRALQRIVLRQ